MFCFHLWFLLLRASFIINYYVVGGSKSIDPSSFAERDNVLIIIIDDFRQLIDSGEVYLPNMKHLARNGIYFKNAYAQQALCAPSRNSMLTGRRPDTLHLYDFYSYWRDSVSNFTTLPQLFKSCGYTTFSVGKVFHPGVSSNFTDDYPYSWTKTPYHPSTEIYKDAPVCVDTVTRKLQSNLICPIDIKDQPKHTLPDMQSVKRAVKFLKRAPRSNKPYLLAIGFHKPHIPLKFPKEYLELYPAADIMPPHHPHIPRDMPTVAWHPWVDVRSRDDISRLNISFPFGVMPRVWARRIVQSYYAAASYVDDMLGILLQHVDLSNTVIMLTSDHGWSLGENGLWAKYSNYEAALKVPLILHIPKVEPREIETPVELIDIFPTLVDITQITKDIPKCNDTNTDLCFEGKSLLPLINRKLADDGQNYTALSQYPRPSEYPTRNSDKPRLKDIRIMGYSLRTNRFRYTEWIRFNNSYFKKDWDKVYGVELYDHALDKYESNNLYNKTVYKDLVQHLSILLRRKANGHYI